MGNSATHSLCKIEKWVFHFVSVKDKWPQIIVKWQIKSLNASTLQDEQHLVAPHIYTQ